MKTQHEESLSLPEFEDRLWDELSQLHGSDSGSPEPPNRSARRRYLVAAGMVALAGLGAGVTAVLTAGRPADIATSPADGGSESAPPPDAIVFTEQVAGDGSVQRQWQDETTGRYRKINLEDGEPFMEWGGATILHADGGATSKDWFVNHQAGTYSESEETFSAEDCPPDQRGCGELGPDLSSREDDVIRGYLNNGSVVEDGLEIVDGRELLRLVWKTLDDASSAEGSGVTWVEPETYRPVKHFSPGGTGPDGQTILESTTTYEYLERTPENLELVEVKIPEGYTEGNIYGP